MNPTLTVVVPVHNVQSSLHESVEHLLEILPELTARFELVLVDDGSTDATRDAAHEVSLSFPQVQLLVQPARLGPQDALRSSLRYAHGEWLLLCQTRPELDLHEIRKLWERRAEEGALFAQTPARATLGSLPPLPGKGPTAEALTPDVLLAPRRLLVAWQHSGERQGVLGFLRSRGYSVQNVEIRDRRRRTTWEQTAAQLQAGFHARPSATTARRTEQSSAAPATAMGKRPHLLLNKLKALAWGE